MNKIKASCIPLFKKINKNLFHTNIIYSEFDLQN